MTDAVLPTPVGAAHCIFDESGALVALALYDEPCTFNVPPVAVPLQQALDAYFSKGTPLERCAIRIALPAATPFRQAVWNVLQTIPQGQTLSYGDVAKRIGSPSASRAVGAACGSNPVSLFVPCHRVIGSSGRLTGYYWGLNIKERLLKHEQRELAA